MSSNNGSRQTKDSGLAESSPEAQVSVTRLKPGSTTSKETLRSRAIESLRPEGERVCFDNMAIDFMDRPWPSIARNRLLRGLLIRQSDREYIGMGGFIVARTRYIDEFLKSQVAEGIKQLVILGAGYDSRAYRFSLLDKGVKVFEVDHPDTQRAKIQRVKKIFGSLPSHVTYVGLDLDEKKLGEGLLEAGYGKDKKTLFIWEGVTVYLTPEAVDETLAFVAGNSGKDSSIIFDYAFQFALDATSYGEEAKKWRKAYERRGEPPKFALKEDEVEEFLSKRGFYQVKSISMESLRKAYFKGVNENRNVTHLGGIAHATVRRL